MFSSPFKEEPTLLSSTTVDASETWPVDSDMYPADVVGLVDRNDPGVVATVPVYAWLVVAAVGMVALSPLGLSGRCRRFRHRSAAHTAAVTATAPTTTPTMIQMRLSLLPLLTPVKCAEIRTSRVPGYIPADLFHVTSLFYSKTCSTPYWSNKATLCSTRYHLVKIDFIIFFSLLVLNCIYVSPQVF